MKTDFDLIRLISTASDELWLGQKSFNNFFGESGAPNRPKEHFEFIKQSNGEMLVALSKANEILGWIGLVPHIASCELAGIEVHKEYRNKGIGRDLLRAAIVFCKEVGWSDLSFQTTPLFTSNSFLYVHNFKACYTYHPNILIDEVNKVPWPFVDCLIRLNGDFETYDFDIGNRKSIIEWNLNRPKIDYDALNRIEKIKTMDMPFLDGGIVMKELEAGNTELFFVIDEVFKVLESRGFRAFDIIKDHTGIRYIFREK